MGRGLLLGKIGGVEVVLDWSLLIIFFLITVALGSGLFAEWHSAWGSALIWGTAVVAAISFLGAVLIHELSHAWVGRARGVGIRRITLFVFGGMAQIENEPRRWQDEFWMAIVGPFTSALIGLACIMLGSLAAGDVNLQPDNLEEGMRELGPVATLLFWLGPVNIILALFNLVPGFPLDGGRVLRAVLWGMTGDLRRATQWASNAGRLFAGVLIACGFAMILGFTIPVFGSGLVNGLWIALIGWFLHNAAIMSFQQQLVRDTLEDVAVEKIMQTNVMTVTAHVSIADFVDDYLMQSEQRAFPVIEEDRFIGLVGMDDLRNAPRESWDTKPVQEIMKAAERLPILGPDASAVEAVSLLNAGRGDEIVVVAQGRLLGVLTRDGLGKWLAIHGDEELDSASGPHGAAPGGGR